jgi:hypothetical protein
MTQDSQSGLVVLRHYCPCHTSPVCTPYAQLSSLSSMAVVSARGDLWGLISWQWRTQGIEGPKAQLRDPIKKSSCVLDKDTMRIVIAGPTDGGFG